MPLEISKKYNLNEDDSILIALSGGSDSMALLNVLLDEQKQNHFEIGAIHLNHGIRDEADAEEEFLEKYCKERDIDFYSKKVNLGECPNLEEKARNARYEFFRETLKKHPYKYLATAHHLNDNAETILMNLSRGSGQKGLEGISDFTEFEDSNLIRPFLSISKLELREYCQNNDIPYFEDKTNNDNQFTRNFIRNEVFPAIEEKYPNVQNKLVQFSSIIKRENHFVNNIVKYLETSWVKNDQNLGIEYNPDLFKDFDRLLSEGHFNFLDEQSKEFLLTEIIRDSLASNNWLKDLSEANINLIIDFFRNNTSGRLELPNNLKAIVASGSYIITNKDLSEKLETYPLGNIKKKDKVFYLNKDKLKLTIRHGKKTDFDLPNRSENRILLKLSELTNSLCIRSRKYGDRIKPFGPKSQKKLNRFMIDKKIPHFIRDKLPLLADKSNIIWIPTYYLHPKHMDINPDDKVVELTLESLTN